MKNTEQFFMKDHFLIIILDFKVTQEKWSSPIQIHKVQLVIRVTNKSINLKIKAWSNLLSKVGVFYNYVFIIINQITNVKYLKLKILFFSLNYRSIMNMLLYMRSPKQKTQINFVNKKVINSLLSSRKRIYKI